MLILRTGVWGRAGNLAEISKFYCVGCTETKLGRVLTPG